SRTFPPASGRATSACAPCRYCRPRPRHGATESDSSTTPQNGRQARRVRIPRLGPYLLHGEYRLRALNFKHAMTTRLTPADFDYCLPPELIAQHPASQRTASRLLRLDATGGLHDLQFTDLLHQLRP